MFPTLPSAPQPLAPSSPGPLRGNAPWAKVERISLCSISRGSCRVRTSRASLAPDEAVVIRSASLLGAAGTVRAVHGDEAEIEFALDLDDRLLSHLVQSPNWSAMVIVTSRPH